MRICRAFVVAGLFFWTTIHAYAQQGPKSGSGAGTTISGASGNGTTTPNPILFNLNGSATDVSNFVWDMTNSRLGINQATPSDALDLAGGKIRLNSGYTSTESYNLAGRVGVGLPVPYFTPTTTNSVIAFDVYPNGTPGNFTSNTGVAWFDLCSTDVNAQPHNYECLRMGKFANGDAHVSAAQGGAGLVRNLDLQINGGMVGIGTTSPKALLSVGSSSPFQVDTTGNIVKLRNVSTNFPSANAPGYLTNDGNGNFSYTQPTNSAATYTASTLPAATAVGATVRVTGGASISNCSSEGGEITRSCQWNGNSWEFQPTGGYVLGLEPGSIPAGTTSFAAPGMTGVLAAENLRQSVIPKACQVSSVYMNVLSPQALSGPITATLRVARPGSPAEDTGVEVAIPAGSSGGVVASDKTHTADLNAGDLISLRFVSGAGAPVEVLSATLFCGF